MAAPSMLATVVLVLVNDETFHAWMNIFIVINIPFTIIIIFLSLSGGTKWKA